MMSPALSRDLARLQQFLSVAHQIKLMNLVKSEKIQSWADLPPELVAEAKEAGFRK
jgi:hypothetical protein